MTTVLITAGLGDFIAIETWLTKEEKESVDTILWATRAENIIKESIELKFIFPNLKCQITLHSEWCNQSDWISKRGTLENGNPFCITGKSQLLTLGGGVDLKKYDIDFDDIVDFSMLEILKNTKATNPRYQGSEYSKHELADIKRFRLPDYYVCIHPYSSNALTPFRDMSNKDWIYAINFLERKRAKAVVLGSGQGDVMIPAHSSIINLIDNTSISEALEITKQGAFFIGAASALSVMAAKRLTLDRMRVKSSEYLLKSTYWIDGVTSDEWHLPLWNFYYSPIDNPSFIVQRIIF